MPKHIFYFKGGEYTRMHSPHEIADDGLVRKALDCCEAQELMYDPELQASAQSSLGDEIIFDKNPEIWAGLEVGDFVYAQLLPGAMGYRGFWATPLTPLPGLTMTPAMVSICEVAERIAADDDPATATNLMPIAPTVDMSACLGPAIKDAQLQAKLEGKHWKQFRNPNAGVFEYFDAPIPAKRGEAMYLRFEVTAAPTGDTVSCSGNDFCTFGPRLEYGFMVDRTCMMMNPVIPHCVCNGNGCSVCPEVDCGGCHSAEPAP